MTQNYQLIHPLPFALIAIQCDEDHIHKARYLPLGAAPQPAQNMLAAEAARQITAYLRRPRGHHFDLPLAPAPTPHQRRVRAALLRTRGGDTQTYGDLARQLKNTSARAVGGACRANQIPLLVPCHRIVAANCIGGFMGESGGDCANIKTALLRLEGWQGARP